MLTPIVITFVNTMQQHGDVKCRDVRRMCFNGVLPAHNCSPGGDMIRSFYLSTGDSFEETFL